jgi:hypothetical protein
VLWRVHLARGGQRLLQERVRLVETPFRLEKCPEAADDVGDCGMPCAKPLLEYAEAAPVQPLGLGISTQ